MDKRRLVLLEKAFSQEVKASISNGIHLMQTRSTLADKMVEEGLLAKSSIKLGGFPPVTIHGYELTHAGRFAYCASCRDQSE